MGHVYDGSDGEFGQDGSMGLGSRIRWVRWVMSHVCDRSLGQDGSMGHGSWDTKSDPWSTLFLTPT